MQYIKQLNEYDDSDDALLDLMGDLADVGFETLQGWVFAWDSRTEEPLAEIMIAGSPRNAFEMYKTNGYFGADLAYAEKGGEKFKTLEDVFKYLYKEKIISSYQFVWGMSSKKENKESCFITIKNNNPFSLVNTLNDYFDNAAERYKREFDSKPSKITI